MTASGAARITGVGYEPEGEVLHEEGGAATGPMLQEGIVVLSGGSLAGNAQLQRTEEGDWRIQGDPTEAAFLVAERKLGVAERRERRFDRVREIPFSAERKMMSSIEIDHEHDDQVVLVTKGRRTCCCNAARARASATRWSSSMRRGARGRWPTSTG